MNEMNDVTNNSIYMNKLPIKDLEGKILIEVTDQWTVKDQMLPEKLAFHVGSNDTTIEIPMPQMIRLLSKVFIATDAEIALAAKQDTIIDEVRNANNIGHLRTILQDQINNIGFDIQCRAILEAYTKHQDLP